MARPIKETPVLRGKDAERFEERLKHPHPANDKERQAAKEAYEKFKSISTFLM